jgi:hypothetical protein
MSRIADHVLPNAIIARRDGSLKDQPAQHLESTPEDSYIWWLQSKAQALGIGGG